MKQTKHTVKRNAWNKGKGKGWIDPRGYRATRVNGKTVREHRVLMERHLGRTLEPWEHVHHKDGDKLNNSIENLEVIDGAAHTIEHSKGSKRSDQTKITLSTLKTMREEINRLRTSNSELLEALEEFIQCGPNAGHNQDLIAQVTAVIAKARGDS